MAKIGIICPDLSGHLNPMMALARQLNSRGHAVTFYQRLIGQRKLEDAGFRVRPFAQQEFPIEENLRQLAELARLKGIKALRCTVDILRKRTRAALRDIPRMARDDGIDAIISDEVCWEGGTIAEQLGVPFITACNAMVVYPEDDIPPFPTTWAYTGKILARARNRLAYRALRLVAVPMLEAVNSERRRLGQTPYDNRTRAVSPLLMISQQPAEFEFPRRELPACFRFCGPMVDGAVRESIEFPFEKLDGQPLIYASMGTLQNRLAETFGHIARACADLPVKLVISLGGGSKPQDLPALAGNPIVVEFAPQLQLLRRAALCVTHAGLNTTLESLGEGVPMVAIPITNDQPGVAARIRWTGCGEFISARRLNAARLRQLVERVLNQQSYREYAGRMKMVIARYGGASRAADLIECALEGKSLPA